MEQGEDVVGDAASVDMVHKGVELGGVSHQPVEHERRLSRGGPDHVGMERAVTPRQPDIGEWRAARSGVPASGLRSAYGFSRDAFEKMFGKETFPDRE